MAKFKPIDSVVLIIDIILWISSEDIFRFGSGKSPTRQQSQKWDFRSQIFPGRAVPAPRDWSSQLLNFDSRVGPYSFNSRNFRKHETFKASIWEPGIFGKKRGEKCILLNMESVTWNDPNCDQNWVLKNLTHAVLTLHAENSIQYHMHHDYHKPEESPVRHKTAAPLISLSRLTGRWRIFGAKTKIECLKGKQLG